MREAELGSPEYYHPTREPLNRRAVTYFPRRETPASEHPTLPWGRDWTTYKRSSCFCRVSIRRADITADRLSPPPRHIGNDPLKAGSAYRRYWAKEEAKRASTMRHAGICLVRLSYRMLARMLARLLARLLTMTVRRLGRRNLG